MTDFFSDLKSASSGFASFDYDEAGYEASDLVKVRPPFPERGLRLTLGTAEYDA